METILILEKTNNRFINKIILILILILILLFSLGKKINKQKTFHKKIITTQTIEIFPNNKKNGKNEKHYNNKAKESAKQKYEDYKKQLEEIKNNKTLSQSEKSQQEKYINKQIKHWKKKMDFSGENHSQCTRCKKNTEK